MKLDKRFYHLISILLAEGVEEPFEPDNMYPQDFIKYAVACTIFNKLEYEETRPLAQNEVMLEVLSELTRLYKKSLSKDYDILKELISYAPDIAETVYNEVYRH